MTNRIQPYEWGTRGKQAFIPKLIGIPSEDDKPYAELWMGTHPAAPSQVEIDGKSIELDEIIKKHPVEILGQTVFEHFGANLPFLFKVLSVGQVLSIQAHPNKSQAVYLHAKDPVHYPDQNHKPEIAIALDELTALVGLLDFPGILESLAIYPNVRDFTEFAFDKNDQIYDNNPEISVKRFYSGLIERAANEPQSFARLIDSLETDIKRRFDHVSESERLFLKLRKIYPPTDIGLIMPLFMNLIHLQAGQAIFLSAGVPHAYVSGNIVECMANSDNVVRVGLTNKFKNVKDLLQILDYSARSSQIMDPEARHGLKIYPTPVEEFYVMNIKINQSGKKEIDTNGKVQIGLVLAGQVAIEWNSGEKLILKQGQSVLIPARIQRYSFQSREMAEVYIATVN